MRTHEKYLIPTEGGGSLATWDVKGGNKKKGGNLHVNIKC